jgi:hypothetical protein
MLNWKKPNTSQYCLWKAELEMYDMEIIHRPGKMHTNADALSRLPSCQQCDLKHDNPVTRRYVKVFLSTESKDDSNEDIQSEKLVMKVSTASVAQPLGDGKRDPELGVVMSLMKAGKISQTIVPHAVKTGNARTKELWRQREMLRIRGDVLYIVKGHQYRLLERIFRTIKPF